MSAVLSWSALLDLPPNQLRLSVRNINGSLQNSVAEFGLNIEGTPAADEPPVRRLFRNFGRRFEAMAAMVPLVEKGLPLTRRQKSISGASPQSAPENTETYEGFRSVQGYFWDCGYLDSSCTASEEQELAVLKSNKLVQGAVGKNSGG